MRSPDDKGKSTIVVIAAAIVGIIVGGIIGDAIHGFDIAFISTGPDTAIMVPSFNGAVVGSMVGSFVAILIASRWAGRR